MKKILFILATSFFFVSAKAQRITREQYVQQFNPWAVYEMYEFGVPASITLAQGLLESGNGNSRLAVEANNHFGIKCHKEWTGDSINVDDDALQECFRKYPSVFDSYRDHSQFLRSRDRYASLFELDRTDYKAWARGLKQAGYATSPTYAEQLIKTIEDLELHKYDFYPDPRESKDALVTDQNKTDQITPTQTETPSNEAKLIQRTNGKQHVKVAAGFSVAELAQKYDVSVEKLYKYNDISSEEMLEKDMNFYIEKKAAEGDKPYHIVAPGETMFQIAQMYAIKQDKLYKLNQMQQYDQPQVGERIYLQTERAEKPLTRSYYEVMRERDREIEKQKQLEVQKQLEQQKLKDRLEKEAIVKALKEKNREEELKIAELQATLNQMRLSSETGKKKNKDLRQELAEIANAPDPEVHYAVDPLTNPVKPAPKYNNVDDNYKPSPTQPQQIKYHTVQPGETLYRISKMYEVAPAQIQQWNNLSDNAIKVGQQLVVQVIGK